MKNTSKILNFVLAAALIVLAVRVTLLKGDKTGNNSEKIMEILMTRTSVRSYTERKVEPEKIEQLLRAAMAAPTAGNKQPWAFIVVTEKEILEKLGGRLPHAKMTANAPLAIIACGDLNKGFNGEAQDFWIQDVSAAIENLLIAAHTLDLGAVWTGVFPMSERVTDVKSILSLPENVIPLAVIPIGYPDAESKPKDKWNPSNIHYNGWNNDQTTDIKQEVNSNGKWTKQDIMKMTFNPFTVFSRDWFALTAGEKDNMNTMTISWGGMGTIWGKERPVVTVYVDRSRHTHLFMENNEYFTLTAFPEQYREKLLYIGTHSGRNEDKIKVADLEVKYTDLGNPAFEQGRMIIECKKLYGALFNPEGFGEVAKQEYSKRDLHSVYIGEVINIWTKE